MLYVHPLYGNDVIYVDYDCDEMMMSDRIAKFNELTRYTCQLTQYSIIIIIVTPYFIDNANLTDRK